MTSPTCVISFLLLPFHSAFDPSLAFLALGALPLVWGLYQYTSDDEEPAAGGLRATPEPEVVDKKLLGGAAIFGAGWGLAGICRGFPFILNRSFERSYNSCSWAWTGKFRPNIRYWWGYPECACLACLYGVWGITWRPSVDIRNKNKLADSYTVYKERR
jgi:hypothetical protein